MKRILVIFLCSIAYSAHGMEQTQQPSEGVKMLLQAFNEQTLPARQDSPTSVTFAQKRKAYDELLTCGYCGYQINKRVALVDHIVAIHHNGKIEDVTNKRERSSVNRPTKMFNVKVTRTLQLIKDVMPDKQNVQPKKKLKVDNVPQIDVSEPKEINWLYEYHFPKNDGKQ